MGSKGKREFIQVLRLMEIAPKETVASAVTQAIQLGAIGFDAVKQILLARIERRPPRLNLEAYPFLLSWSPETGQVAKVGSTERKDGPDDGQAEAVFG